MSIVLSDQELAEITGLARPTAQAKWLRDTYGIIAARRPDGTLSVPRDLYLQKAGMEPGSDSQNQEPELRFG